MKKDSGKKEAIALNGFIPKNRKTARGINCR
jgi:hypothetical protein